VTSVVNRYYDPATDQFLSIDLKILTSNQPYVFTNDDPLNLEDPSGMMPVGPSQYASNWPKGNLQGEIENYLGSDIGVEEGSSSSKIVFYDLDDPDKQVVYDVTNNSFRIARVSNGEWEYYDRASDTWGANDQLGSQGLENSHYSNTGDSYDSVDDAVQQLGNVGLSTVDGGDGDGGGDFDIGGLGLFGIFPSVCQLAPSACTTSKGIST
jgi:hypothetical protein